MNIVLVQPPVRHDGLFFPTGLLRIGSVLKKLGYKNVKIIDLQYLTCCEKLLILDKSYFQKATKIILRENPEVVGFSVMSTNLPSSVIIARNLKKSKPRLKIIFGGPIVEALDLEILKNFPFIDLIVRGEGETTIAEVIEMMHQEKSLRAVSGISFREGGILIRNKNKDLIKNLNELPMIDYSLLPKYKKYFRFRKGSIYIEVGRGCPFSCIFCSACRFWRRKVRLFSLKYVMEETEKLMASSKIEYLNVLLDNFLLPPDYFHKFCAFMTKLKMSWSCSLRLDLVNKETIKLMRGSHCDSIFFGIESGDKTIQRAINKNINLKKADENIKYSLKVGIDLALSFIFGFPMETRNKIDKTLRMALKYKILGAKCSLHGITFDPGSELFKAYKNQILLDFDNKYELNFSKTITRAKIEYELIKNNPSVFSYFGFLSSNHFDRAQIFYIETLYSQILNHYPFTLRQILKDEKLSPLGFIENLVSFYDDGLDKRKLIDTNLRYIRRLLHKYILDKGSKFVRWIFRKENSIVNDFFFRKNENKMRS